MSATNENDGDDDDDDDGDDDAFGLINKALFH